MTPLPKLCTGDDPLVGVINRMITCIRERTVKEGTAVKLEYRPEGTRINAQPQVSAAGGEVEQFRLVYERQDYVGGYRLTEGVADESEIIRIAKPPELRVAGWDGDARVAAGLDRAHADGATYVYEANSNFVYGPFNPWNRRTATYADPANLAVSGDAGETAVPFRESIWPRYMGSEGSASIIYAILVKQAPVITVTEREVTGPDPSDYEDVDYDVSYIDLNVAGRRFEPDFRRVKMCFYDDAGVVTSGFVMVRTSSAFDVEDE